MVNIEIPTIHNVASYKSSVSTVISPFLSIKFNFHVLAVYVVSCNVD